MNGYNLVIVMGTAGADAEVRQLEGGSSVANMNVAVNESYNDKQGNRQQKTEWVKVEAWNGLANFLGSYGKKGTQFLIEGKLRTESYEKDGITKYTTKVVANKVQFAGFKNNNTQTTAAPAQQPTAAPAQAAPAQAAPAQAAPAQAAPAQAAPAQAAPAQAAPVQEASQQVGEYVTSNDFTQNTEVDDLPF